MLYRKTALMLALCKFLRDKYSLAAVSNISQRIFYILFFEFPHFGGSIYYFQSIVVAWSFYISIDDPACRIINLRGPLNILMHFFLFINLYLLSKLKPVFSICLEMSSTTTVSCLLF